MATKTKQSAKLTPRAKPVKNIGAPIEKSKTYTMAQLRECLSVSRVTLWRYYSKLDMNKFVTPIIGRNWQITGEQYYAWLEWRRNNAPQNNGV